jgi:transcriptional regulator with XRE-family HTH domain
MIRRLAQKATLASNLRAARERAGISQETLAQRADMHRNAVALIEAGKRDPRVSTVAKLAKALGVATEELLTGL